MKFTHHSLDFELEDDWWAEAGMQAFVPRARAYRVDHQSFQGRRIYEVLIEEVEPAARRAESGGIFRDNEQRSARDRVIDILKGFVSGSSLPPVEVARCPSGSPYKYRLTHGAHRFYCSLAAGFTAVPAVDGFDWERLMESSSQLG